MMIFKKPAGGFKSKFDDKGKPRKMYKMYQI